MLLNSKDERKFFGVYFYVFLDVSSYVLKSASISIKLKPCKHEAI